MELADSQIGRRSLRARTSNSSSTSGTGAGAAAVGSAGAGQPGSGTPGSESPRSDVSDGRGSRSSRLSNPEFAAKHKAFMAKVTAANKGSMESYLTTEILTSDEGTGQTGPGGKRKASMKGGDDMAVKRRKTKKNSNGLDTLNDAYCWICHKEGSVICCETCPRVFHLKCIGLETSPAEDWVCPECVLIMTAENMDTRSRAMRLLTVDQLCTLLKHALARMKSVPTSEPFLKPVDPVQFPAYKDYISCPMDIQSMERNIRRKQYGSTEAMLADCKWILHNCIIFNSTASKLTSIAKNIVKVCKHEMQEIENCPDCYLNAHIKKDTWFTEACRFPHCIVWAKLKGFPYWPGKIMRVKSDENSADIRFFGAHDRSWIALKDVFLYSERPPLDIKKKRGNLDDCLTEVNTHIRKITERFGEFALAPHKTHYDFNKEEEMLKIQFPKFVLPFEIGSLARRARSYSFTGSERSHGGTPTPSDTSMMEDEDEEEELEEEIETELDNTGTEDTSTAAEAQQLEEGATQPDYLDTDAEDVNQTHAQDVIEDEESQPRMMRIVNECEMDDNEDKVEATDSGIIYGDKDESAEIPEALQSGMSVSQNVSSELESLDENAMDKESVDVAEEIIEDSIEQSVDGVQNEDADVIEERDTPDEEEIEGVTVIPEAEDITNDDDDVEDSSSCVDKEPGVISAVEDKPREESEADRSTISPPCEVTSTTATPGPNCAESQTQTKDNDVMKDGRIHGVIENTLEPVIVEDEDPSDEIDDVEPMPQSETEEDFSNDVMEVQDDEECVIDNEIVSIGETAKQLGETSKARTLAGGDRDDIDDMEPSDDSQEPKSSKQEKAPLDPTKLLAAGVSITVIDKKKASGSEPTTAQPPAAEAGDSAGTDSDLGSDISVTVVQKTKTDTSSGKFTLSLKRESDLLDPEKAADKISAKRKSLNEEEKAPPDAIVTISKISHLKESKDPLTTNSTDTKKFQMSSSSPGPQLRSPASSPSPGMMGHPGHRLPGYRGPGHLGPRPMMGMMPGQPMMRGQYRGPMPGHGAGHPHLPNLQPRPSGVLAAHPSLPSAAGPVADQLNRVAGKLADYMRQNLEDLFKDLSQQGSPEATIKGLQLELEKMQWRHQQELAEVKHNADLIMMEMRSSLEADKQRAIADCRKQAEIEKQKAISETKKKQWCAMCGKEAIFYCCWNTSYCDYPCQQAHWPTHMSTCAQNGGEGADSEAGAGDTAPADNNQLPQHFLAGSAHFQQQQQVAAPAGNGLHHRQGGRPGPVSRPMRGRMAGPGPGVPASMAGMRFHMQPRLPGHGFTRPYFM